MRSPLRRRENEERSVLAVQPKMGRKQERGKAAGVSTPAERFTPRAPSPLVRTMSKTLRRATWADALALMLDPSLADGEGTSIGAVGAPRFGKTTLMQRFVDAALTRGLCERVLIHDTKKPGKQQYEGIPCASVEEYIAGEERYTVAPVVVLNGPDWQSQPTLNDACEIALALHAEGQGVLVVSDEVYGATNGYGQFSESEIEGRSVAMFPRFIREGTSQRISSAWTTQIPQELPTACKVLTRAVAQFHLESLAADAATEKFRLDADGPQVLRSLARGEFVLFCQGQDWNRTIYGPDMG